MTVAVGETAAWPAIPRAWRLAALVAWIAGMATVALFSLSSQLGPPEGPGMDKIVHFLGYMTLALQAQPAFATRRGALIAALCMIPFGLVMEFGQDYVPGRQADGFDAMANSIGALIGIALAPAFRRLCARFVARR
ncbi:MAG: VanZ family protein [Alphaproteobacteria bacterium]